MGFSQPRRRIQNLVEEHAIVDARYANAPGIPLDTYSYPAATHLDGHCCLEVCDADRVVQQACIPWQTRHPDARGDPRGQGRAREKGRHTNQQQTARNCQHDAHCETPGSDGDTGLQNRLVGRRAEVGHNRCHVL